MRWFLTSHPRGRSLQVTMTGRNLFPVQRVGVVQSQMVFLNTRQPSVNDSAPPRGDRCGAMDDLWPSDPDAVGRTWAGYRLAPIISILRAVLCFAVGSRPGRIVPPCDPPFM